MGPCAQSRVWRAVPLSDQVLAPLPQQAPLFQPSPLHGSYLSVHYCLLPAWASHSTCSTVAGVRLLSTGLTFSKILTVSDPG